MCIHAHQERELRSPLRPGSRACLRALETLQGFWCSLVLSILIQNGINKNRVDPFFMGGGAPVAPPSKFTTDTDKVTLEPGMAAWKASVISWTIVVTNGASLLFIASSMSRLMPSRWFSRALVRVLLIHILRAVSLAIMALLNSPTANENKD